MLYNPVLFVGRLRSIVLNEMNILKKEANKQN